MTVKNPIDEVLKTLEAGNVIIYPTETLYGMGVDAHNPKAVEKLFQLKKRALNKPVPVLLPHKKFISRYCNKISPIAAHLMQNFWPGALTIVLESDKFSTGVSDHGKVGFRVSSHPFTQTLLHKFDRCITATSANISDKPTPSDPQEFFRIFPANSFLLVEEKDPSKPTKPSTVIDCTGETYKIIREGAISEKQIRESLTEAKFL